MVLAQLVRSQTLYPTETSTIQGIRCAQASLAAPEMKHAMRRSKHSA
jgi:hypothetical protein